MLQKCSKDSKQNNLSPNKSQPVHKTHLTEDKRIKITLSHIKTEYAPICFDVKPGYEVPTPIKSYFHSRITALFPSAAPTCTWQVCCSKEDHSQVWEKYTFWIKSPESHLVNSNKLLTQENRDSVCVCSGSCPRQVCKYNFLDGEGGSLKKKGLKRWIFWTGDERPGQAGLMDQGQLSEVQQGQEPDSALRSQQPSTTGCMIIMHYKICNSQWASVSRYRSICLIPQ